MVAGVGELHVQRMNCGAHQFLQLPGLSKGGEHARKLVSAEALGGQVGECGCFSVAAEITTNWDSSSIKDPSAKSCSDGVRKSRLHILGTETRRAPCARGRVS